MGKSKNHYYALMFKIKEKEGAKEEEKTVKKICASWPECQEEISRASKEKSRASRIIYRGFPTKDEAQEFLDGTWKRQSISKEAETWLEEYKTRPGQLKPDTELDLSELSSGEYPKYCAYVDGSYNAENKIYGFGVVFICDGKIEKFYGGGQEENLASMGCGAGELLACMEAIKHAEALDLSELTIVYDSQIIQWAYLGCGKEMLTQAAGRYADDMRGKMRIEVESIKGLSHQNKIRGNDATALADKAANSLADKLARKGAGVVD